MKGEKEVLLESGCNDFLSKPFTQQQLLDVIRPFTVRPSGISIEQVGDRRKLMIVEDHQDAAQAVAQLLELFGWHVSITDCVESALTTAESLQPDLIMLDLNLPDGNGLDLALQLRKKCPTDIRIVLMSGSMPSDAECKNFGIDRSLLKPVDMESLKNLSNLLPA
jgi:two-component system sensor histidine kinase/response regulator